ncbi:hypothetical protein NEOLEDRAFT_683179 [Neolentinus lepideus HHB14362 ss-1]|uniref:Alpha/beta hydrolase fold-3 domain-containing protein n=1 Tax=Neolentinus lepideus HHB14362 ss-1 TaxID=1314782 RepID=A0A165UZI7_9AGAM|nr:hypothetical protein NEOLEDRAFT_683179 [Neolentinus lepideus HHB14362 ss-1]
MTPQVEIDPMGTWLSKFQVAVPGVKEIDTLLPGSTAHKIPVRIHAPEVPLPNNGSPLVVIMHGGGFSAGGLDSETQASRLLAKELGTVVVNVDYRLAPQHPFPAAPNDCWDATKWAHANAATLGADPSKGFILFGTSSGGNLAAVCAVLARDTKLSPPVTGLCLLVPCVFDWRDIPEKYKDDIKSYEEQKDAATLNKKAIDRITVNYKPDGSSTLFNLYAPGATRAGLPPTFLQICELDPLRDEAVVFERELREELNIPTKKLVYPNQPHGFWAFFPHLEESKTFRMDTLEGVKWLMGFVGKEQNGTS